MKVAIYTLGCKVNQYETQAMEQELARRGHELVDFSDAADAYVINTCSVTAVSDQKSRQVIHRIQRRRPGAVVAVCGCYPQTHPEDVRALGVDLVAGTGDRAGFVTLLEETASGRRGRTEAIDRALERRTFEILPAGGMESRTRAMLKIEDGCVNFCSYCIVPYVRGRERSRQVEDIVAEFKSLVEQGYKEITLLGQNVNSFGKDLEPRVTFANLLRMLNDIDGDFRIRFMTSHPKDCTKELIETMAQCDKVAEHLHLPFQSGSNRVLKAMNRHYTREQYLELIKYARKLMGDELSITSDIIVGFPGETYEEFKETLSLVKEINATQLFTFIYSKREGTPAAKMDDPVSAEEKSRWFKELTDLQETISASQMKLHQGKTYKCYVYGKGKLGDNYIAARNDGNLIIEFEGDESLIGTFQNIKVIEPLTFVMRGELVKEKQI